MSLFENLVCINNSVDVPHFLHELAIPWPHRTLFASASAAAAAAAAAKSNICQARDLSDRLSVLWNRNITGQAGEKKVDMILPVFEHSYDTMVKWSIYVWFTFVN